MPHVFVNGISAKSGGGRSILTNLLRAAREADDSYRFTVAVPSRDDYDALAGERIRLLPMGELSRSIMIPYASMVSLPRLIRRCEADLLFNLADIPVATSLPQVFLFDWSYAAFPDSPAWHLSSPADRVVRWAKLAMFSRLLHHVDVLVAQNEVLADQLRLVYGFETIPIVNNAVSIDNLAAGHEVDFRLGDGYKLLCLSAYYSHKNIEIFIPLAQRIKASGLDVKIITTIDPAQNRAAKAFLANIKSNDLGGVINNIGNIAMSYVPSLYRQTDGLILPTLLESFSGTYVEAMFHRKPILTSDLPFAHGVCGDGAFYFDPYDVESIFSTILEAKSNVGARESRLQQADSILRTMPSWNEAYTQFRDIFSTTLALGGLQQPPPLTN